MGKEVAVSTLAQHGGTRVFTEPSQANLPSLLPSMFRLASSGGQWCPQPVGSLLRERWGGAVSCQPSPSPPLWGLSHSQKCEHKVNSTGVFMWLQVDKEWLLAVCFRLNQTGGVYDTARRKTFLLNEPINNIAMGTSVDEQMLCSHVCFHYFHALLFSVCSRSTNEQNAINSTGALRILACSALQIYYGCITRMDFPMTSNFN